MRGKCFQYVVCLAVLAMQVIFSGCSSNESSEKKILNGAGATFPYPLYSKWAYKYHEITGFALNYQSIGSGAGIAQIKAGTVDFGASDAPLTGEELDAAGLVQFPMVIGGVVPVVNIQGVGAGQLKLTSQLLADIFLGKIKTWNDDAIKRVNQELNLPDRAITVAHRSDGSGTTWIFTNYLDKVSSEWHNVAGAGKAVKWPAGVGGKGNEGVAAYVQRLDGAIGYVEYAYALQNGMAYVLLQNSSGEFVAPSIESFQAAAGNADWKNAPGFYVTLTSQPGRESWPIAGASFILIRRDQKNIELAKNMISFFDWCYRHGGQTARELDYVPMPEAVIELIVVMWAKEITANGQPAWSPAD